MRRIVLTLAGAAVLSACGAAGPSNTAPPATSGAGSAGTTISTGSTSLGTVLTDSRGFTLYYFLPEKNSTIGACTAGCLAAWPPVVATGTPTAVSGVTGTLATVSVMVNGAAVTEVTYNGWPLHTFASDTAPGQTGGNGVSNNWFAAMPGTSSSATGATTGSGSTPTPATTPTNTPGGYGY
jgi:predicted lipoprotein with Yx(FWY)xxD motif